MSPIISQIFQELQEFLKGLEDSVKPRPAVTLPEAAPEPVEEPVTIPDVPAMPVAIAEEEITVAVESPRVVSEPPPAPSPAPSPEQR